MLEEVQGMFNEFRSEYPDAEIRMTRTPLNPPVIDVERTVALLRSHIKGRRVYTAALSRVSEEDRITLGLNKLD
jgi:hypothetical protein